ncbi:tetratricopeptide repeat protein, partial [candidate division KSB1 bacterium]|nr:tetratricopeptide repeat protein [candidate division KSB1 bacterium]
DEDQKPAGPLTDNRDRAPRTMPPPEDESSGSRTAEESPAEPEEDTPSPLPTYGPDFSTYPHKEEDDEINEFIDHLDRMGAGNEADSDQEGESADQKTMMSTPTDAEASPPEDDDSYPDDVSAEGTKEKFVTPTLGEIYAAQGQYAKAISVFEMLLKKNPDNDWYRTKLEYLRKRLQEEKK